MAAAVVDPQPSVVEEQKKVTPLMMAEADAVVADTAKPAAEFRNFADSPHQRRVEKLYGDKYKSMTLDRVLQLKSDYGKLNRCKMSIKEAMNFLNTIVDESDPDVDLPQIFHCYQTAEACRKMEPDNEWFMLTGLIHDLGKVLAHKSFGALAQEATVGDIYPVGCKPDVKANVLGHLFEGCPDNDKPELRTDCGIYQQNGGLDKLHMAYSHDEYLYQVLAAAPAEQMKLPPEALYIIRFHSFYPFHCPKRGAYRHLASDYDSKVGLPLLQKFSRCDLYSKAEDDVAKRGPSAELVKFYDALIEKYLPGVFAW